MLARQGAAVYVARNKDSPRVTQGQINLDDWMDEIRHQVDERLREFFVTTLAESADLSPLASELVTEVRDLTMRGGKRLRPIVTAAGYRAAHGPGTVSPTVDVGAALELLQSYLLIHDDWMDEDDERRGGPAVHYVFQQRHGHAHLGASLGILAGDLASTFSWELFASSAFPEAQRCEAIRLFVRIQKEVFAGQQLDLMANEDVERMHDLKTGSYTTRGPAELGGLLAGGTPEAMLSLRNWSAPLGVAFQLRDDLLSTFGEARLTGKPGDDLRHGKNNAVVAAFQKLGPSDAQRAAVDAVWGKADASDELVVIANEALGDAKASVERRLAFLSDEARTAIAASDFDDEAKALLEDVTRRLTDRGH